MNYIEGCLTTASYCSPVVCEVKAKEPVKFYEVVQGVRDYLSSVRDYKYNQKLKKVEDDFYASKEYTILVDLIKRHQDLRYRKIRLNFWESDKSIKAEMDNVENQFLETAKKLTSNKCAFVSPYTYEIHEIKSFLCSEIPHERYIGHNEVEAKLHMISDWESKSFAELAELIKNG